MGRSMTGLLGTLSSEEDGRMSTQQSKESRMSRSDSGSFIQSSINLPTQLTTIYYDDGRVGVSVKIPGPFTGDMVLTQEEVKACERMMFSPRHVAYAVALAKATIAAAVEAENVIKREVADAGEAVEECDCGCEESR